MLQTKGILNYTQDHMGDPCGKYITDKEFLVHMIPHHQVAIDMSKEVLKYTNDPSIIYLARSIIFSQTDQILFMENFLLSGIPNMASKGKSHYIKMPNQFTVWYPKESRADTYQCGLHHFSSKMAKMHKLKKGKPLSDQDFMKNMIYHHDVAIEMSERMVKNSTNPTIITFANDIIKAQRLEIFIMKKYLTDSQQQCAPKFMLPGKELEPINSYNYNQCSIKASNKKTQIETFFGKIQGSNIFLIIPLILFMIYMIFIK